MRGTVNPPAPLHLHSSMSSLDNSGYLVSGDQYFCSSNSYSPMRVEPSDEHREFQRNSRQPKRDIHSPTTVSTMEKLPSGNKVDHTYSKPPHFNQNVPLYDGGRLLNNNNFPSYDSSFQYDSYSSTHTVMDSESYFRYYSTGSQQTANEPYTVTPPSRNDPNEVDIEKLESGEETRTCVMIRNLPNKYRREDVVQLLYSLVNSFFYIREL